MMDKTRIEELIFRHFSGKTSPSEEKEIYDYVSSDRGNRQFYEECEADWKQNRIPTMQQREAFVRLKAEIGRRRRVRGVRYLLASLAACQYKQSVWRDIQPRFDCYLQSSVPAGHSVPAYIVASYSACDS